MAASKSKSRSAGNRKPTPVRSSPTQHSAPPRSGTGNGTVVRNGSSAVAVRQSRAAGSRASAEKVSGAVATAVTLVPVWLQITAFVLAILGLIDSAYLTYTHFTESHILGCSANGFIDCEKVTTSPQSYVFGIPVAVLGLAFYLFAVPIMSPWAWRAARREIHIARLASILVGMCFVLYLIYAELYEINNICLYCTGVHIITFLLFVLTVTTVALWGVVPRRREEDFDDVS
jgi:uncharacterized membrane protein